MKSSHSVGSVELQSASLPGGFRRWDTAPFRCTCWAAAREALRARDASTARAASASPAVRLALSAFSRALRTIASMTGVTSALLSRSFVCPWNCGWGILIARSATIPSRTSSAVSATPRGTRLWTVA